MKNLKISENIFKKGKMVLLPITLAAAITLSGCSLIPNGDRARYKNDDSKHDYSYSSVDSTTNNNPENNQATNNTQAITFAEYDIPMKNIGGYEKTNTKINFTDNNYNSIKSYLDSINVTYEYENLYKFEESLTEYNKLNLVNSHSNELKNITVDELYNIILKNNEVYEKKVKKDEEEKFSNQEVRKICALIIETANKYIYENSDIDIDRFKCVLSNLKVFKSTFSVANAYVTDDNCLVIAPRMFDLAIKINGEDTKKDILMHEIIHLLQKGCNCDLNKNTNLKRNFGFSYGFKNLEVNSLDFTWIYESSAEKNMMNLTGHNPLVYQNMIGYLESLSLANLLNDSYKVNDTEELSFKRDLNDLYSYFGVTTDKDKKEILNLMYSLEIMHQHPTDFYNVLTQATGRPFPKNFADDPFVDEVNYTVKVSICETLTKLFYKNLAKNLVNKDATLEDVFYLISLFENDLNSHIKYKDSTKYSYNDRFIETYLNIQDNFFYELSKSTGYSQEEIESKFDGYTAHTKEGNNYSLNFLNKEKITYLEEREAAMNLSATISIRDASNEFSKQNLQKVYN